MWVKQILVQSSRIQVTELTESILEGKGKKNPARFCIQEASVVIIPPCYVKMLTKFVFKDT